MTHHLHSSMMHQDDLEADGERTSDDESDEKMETDDPEFAEPPPKRSRGSTNEPQVGNFSDVSSSCAPESTDLDGLRSGYSTQQNSPTQTEPEVQPCFGLGHNIQTAVAIENCKNMVVNVGATAKIPHINTEELVKRYRKRNKCFVKTSGYEEAKSLLRKHHIVMIIGLPGDGKSSVAIQLLLDHTDTHTVVKLHNIEEFDGKLNRDENQIILLDDVFGRSALDKSRIDTIESHIEHIQSFLDDKTLVVMSSQTSIFKEADSLMKKITIESKIVNLSGNYKPTEEEKEEIFREYVKLKNVKGDITNFHGNVEKFAKEVSRADCPLGFPQCVSMFTNSKLNLIERGLQFFKFPFEHFVKVLERIQTIDPDLYSVMLLLAFKNGRMMEDDLADDVKNDSFMALLENTLGRKEVMTLYRVKEIIETYDGVYLRRFVEEGAVGFHHYSYVEAICFTFSKRFKKEAIKHLPFKYSFQGFRTNQYKGNERVIVLEKRDYQYLAEKFAVEILSGNIQTICSHQACKDHEFTEKLLRYLKFHHEQSQRKACQSPFKLMERELEIRETFNGSILYWSAVSGAEALCTAILETKVYKNMSDKHWVKLQATAALVHACNHGFPKQTLKRLLKLGANLFCQHQITKEYGIKFCDSCNVFDENGISPLQAVLMSKKPPTSQEYLLKVLLSKVSDVEKQKQENKLILNKALKEAIKNNNTGAVNILEPYCDLETIDSYKGSVDHMSCLWYAVDNQNIDLVKMLAQKLNSTETDDSGITILMRAKKLEIVKLLVDCGVSVNKKDHRDRTALFFAHDSEIASYLINTWKLNVNERDSDNMTPLHVFAQEGGITKQNLVSSLLSNDVDVFAKDFENRYPLELVKTPEISEVLCKHLKSTMSKHHQDVITVITSSLKSVTEVPVLENILDYFKALLDDTAQHLQVALLSHANHGTLSSQLLQFFIAENVNINAFDDLGSILHHLCKLKTDLKKILKILKSRSLSADVKDQDGNTPFHIACKFSQIGSRIKKMIIQFLLEEKANVNARNKKGETPLHFLFQTISEGSSDILELIIGGVVDVNAQSILGSSALQLLTSVETPSLVLKREAKKCVIILMKRGAYPESVNLNCFVSPLLSSCRTNLGIFEELAKSVKNCQDLEILQILDFCVLSPSNINAWKVIKILKSSGIIHLSPLGHSSQHDGSTKGFHLTQDTIDDICNRTEVTSEVVRLMLNFDKVTCQKTIDKYFYYGLRFYSIFDIDATRKDQNGRTYLMQAILRLDQTRNRKFSESSNQGERSDLDIIGYLLDKKIDVNHKDRFEHTALYYTIRLEDSDENVNELVELLVKKGAFVCSEKLLISASACKVPRPKVFDTLIAKGADKKECNDEGRNAIFILVQNYIQNFRLLGDISSTIRHLSEKGVLVDKKDKNDQTALQYAIERFTSFDSAHRLFKSAFIDVLLECGADANVVEEDSGQTTLHKAVTCNNYRETDLLKLLIRKGGDKFAIDKKGRGLLHCAVQRMNHDSVKTVLYLLSDGMDVNLQDKEGNTPLHTLVLKCCPVVKEASDKVDLDVDHVWCGPLRTSVMKCLLMYKAAVDKTNFEGKTPLHLIVEKYKEYQDRPCDPRHILLEMLSMLLSYGCDIFVKDKYGKSAVDYADEWSLMDLQKCISGEVSPEVLLQFPKCKDDDAEIFYSRDVQDMICS